MSDAIFRQIEILRFLKRVPHFKTTQQIHEHLSTHGHEVSLRTIQRNLNDLSTELPLISNEEEKSHNWAWSQDAPAGWLGMDETTALSFIMALRLIDKALPPSVIEHLNNLEIEAHNVLSKRLVGNLKKWPAKVRVIAKGQSLRPPKISVGILETIYEALLNEKRFAGLYERKDGFVHEMVVNPLGLVVRDNMIYIIATLNEYKDLRQLVLHRFKSAELTTEQVIIPSDFSLDQYIDEGEMGVKESDESVKLKIRIVAGQHLQETPLSHDQVIESDPFKDGWKIITATVSDTNELRWWLLGFGRNVEVLEPSFLREEIASQAKDMFSFYK